LIYKIFYFAGMPLFQTIQVMKSQDVAIKGVHLCYNEQVLPV